MKKLIYLFLGLLIVSCNCNDTSNSKESWLFVHTADNAQVTNTTTIVMPVTNDIFAFTDRPYRKHIYMNGEKFASLWSETSENSFKTDPPNAVLTWMDGGEIKEVEVVITGVSSDGDTITYTINDASEVITGDILNVSLFVDTYNNQYQVQQYSLENQEIQAQESR